MVEPNCNPPLNCGIPKEDWEHVFALSRKYPLMTIYQMFMDVHPEKRESSASSTSWSSGIASSGGSSRGSFASSRYDIRNSLTSNSSAQSCASYAGNSDTSTQAVNFSRSEQVRPSNSNISDVSVPPPPPKPYFCTFCAELNTTTFFGRKHDWKVHEIDFHCGSHEWPCCECSSVFDQFKKFEKHFKNAHPEINRPAIADDGVKLQHKRIFACGFSGCRGLLTSQDARFHHVAYHMEKQGAKRNQWSYSIVILNLLRQPGIKQEWKAFIRQQMGTENLIFSWTPLTSRRLRQKLECQNFSPDVQSLVKAAWILGRAGSTQSNPSSDQILHNVLQVPTMNSSYATYSSEPLVDQQPLLVQRPQPSNEVSSSFPIPDDTYMRELESFPLPPSATQNTQFFSSENVSNQTFGSFIQSNTGMGNMSESNYPAMAEPQTVDEATQVLQDSSMMEFAQNPILGNPNTTAEVAGSISTVNTVKLAESDSQSAFQFHDYDSFSASVQQYGHPPRHGSLGCKWKLRPRSHEKPRSELQNNGHDVSTVTQVPQTPLHVSQQQSPRSPESLPDV